MPQQQQTFIPATTAITSYGNFAGLGIALGSQIIAGRLHRKEVPLGTVAFAIGLVIVAGIIGANMLAANAREAA